MNLRRIIGGLVLAAFASVLVYAVLAVLSDAPAVAAALRSFPPLTLVSFLLLALGCFVVRAIRWGALMRLVGHPVSLLDAIYLQFSGHTMSVTPGRVGELLKPWLARDVAGMPMSRGAALVFTERVADLIAVIILSLGGLSFLGGGQWGLGAALAAIVAGTALASSQWFHALALRVVERQSWARKHRNSAAVMSETVRLSLSWRTLAWSVPASVLAWGLEGVGFALSLNALGFAELDPVTAVSVYAVSTIIGAFTFLPGGIGLTEASMAGILVAAGMGAPAASAATLVTRVATLWWGVLVGWVALASRPAVLRSVLRSDDTSA